MGPSPDAFLAASVLIGLALLSALVWLARRMGNLDALERTVNEMAALSQKELTHNGGSSMKDMARDSRDDARAARLSAAEAKALAERTDIKVEALHRRFDEDRVHQAGRDGERKASIEHLQATATQTRIALALHVHEAQAALDLIGQDVPPLTQPEKADRRS